MFRKNLKGLLFIGTAAILAACGNGAEEGNDAENGADTTEPTTLVVASTMPPMTDIVEIAAVPHAACGSPVAHPFLPCLEDKIDQ